MIERKNRTPIMHRVVAHNGLLHFGGIAARDLSQDMRGQTRQVLQQLEALLTEAGSDKTKVVSATVYLSDFSGKAEMSAAWTEFFAPDHLPARATIGVAELGEGILVEVVATAAA